MVLTLHGRPRPRSSQKWILTFQPQNMSDRLHGILGGTCVGRFALARNFETAQKYFTVFTECRARARARACVRACVGACVRGCVCVCACVHARVCLCALQMYATCASLFWHNPLTLQEQFLMAREGVFKPDGRAHDHSCRGLPGTALYTCTWNVLLPQEREIKRENDHQIGPHPHPPNVLHWAASIRQLKWKTLCSFEPNMWLEKIAPYDAKSAYFGGSRCEVMW